MRPAPARPSPMAAVTPMTAGAIAGPPPAVPSCTPVARMKSSTRTARMAPIGSETMPSHLTMSDKRRDAWTCRNNGMTTVGPVTTRMAPRRTARGIGKSSRMYARAAETNHVIGEPMTSRLRTAGPIALSLRMSRFSPPSNRMIATARLTVGNSISPNNASGSSQPVTGPAMNPANRRRRIDGMRRRHASHWALIPMTKTLAIPTRARSKRIER